MGLDPIRRIISGKKARYTNEEHNLDLDLVQLTDRVTLMGYPASGTAAFYRNKRSEVIRYISLLPTAPLIVNLCPRYENSYPSSALSPPADKALRFPFPDHYPPPLSLLPVAVKAIDAWMKGHEEGTLMIHCKAGKGRSGTMALSYLLSLPGLPSAPSLLPLTPSSPTHQPIDPSSHSETSSTSQTHQEKLIDLLEFHTSRRMAPGTTSRGVSIASQRRWLGYWAEILDGDDPRPTPTPEEVTLSGSGLRRVRIDWIKINGPGPSGLVGMLGGEKIAVQVFHYRPSISSGLRKRELASVAPSSSDGAVVESPFDDEDWDDEEEDMIQRVGGFSESSSSSSSSSSTNPTSTTTEENSSEETQDTPIALTPTTTAPSSPRPSSPLSPTSPTTPTSSSSAPSTTTRLLTPSSIYIPSPTSPSSDVASRTNEESKRVENLEKGLVLNGDEGIQFKLLLGKSGRKHADYLPAMAALGIIWFIPSFESSPQTSSNMNENESIQKIFKVAKGEIDFLKPQSGIEGVEIGFTWV